MKSSELAQELGHRDEVIAVYEKLKTAMSVFNNDHVAELDIIYFLPNILWSNNFELVARVVKEYGYKERLQQWLEELNK